MSIKYRETSFSGSSYIRCDSINIINGSDNKRIRFNEVEVTTLGDGRVDKKPAGSVGEFLSEDSANTSFSILNPEDNTDTGTQMTYGGVYAALYSLYLHLAKERDQDQATTAEE